MTRHNSEGKKKAQPDLKEEAFRSNLRKKTVVA